MIRQSNIENLNKRQLHVFAYRDHIEHSTEIVCRSRHTVNKRVCLQHVNQLTGGWVGWPVEANIDVADDVDRIYEHGEPINSIIQLNEERRGRCVT